MFLQTFPTIGLGIPLMNSPGTLAIKASIALTHNYLLICLVPIGWIYLEVRDHEEKANYQYFFNRQRISVCFYPHTQYNIRHIVSFQ